VLIYALERSGIQNGLSGKSEEDQERLENLKELVSLATSRYDALPSPEGLLRLFEDAALATDQDELDHTTDRTKGDAVTLMTVHAAKGLEFRHVFITGLEEGLFPHERMGERGVKDEEEERRLFYVALTRAKEKVHLSYAQMRTVFGQRLPRMPSEFVMDIDEKYIEVDGYANEDGREKVVYLD
jgi:DNA helicase-2/ATP-dependent DNA helicase PcrA